MIVVDANTIIYLVRETSFTGLARDVYAADPEWVVPPLWKPEVLNALLKEVRAGHIDVAAAIEAANMASRILADRARDCAPAAILRAAEEARLTAYDACYVGLAHSLGVVLVTEDKQKIHVPGAERQFYLKKPKHVEDPNDLYLVETKHQTIDLNEALRQEFLLHFPIIPVCSKSCKGMCPKEEKIPDNKPLAQLKKLLK